MRENCIGTAVSILVHSCIILPLVAAPFTAQNRPARVVEVDFSLMKGPGPVNGSPGKAEKEVIKKRPQVLKRGAASKRGAAPKRETASRRMVKQVLPAGQDPEAVPAKEQVEPPPVPTIVTASDARGETVIHGTPATYAGSAGSGNSLWANGGSADGTGGTGGGTGGGGTGKGGGVMFAEGKDYNYIRDAVMKNIEYPERARRMGLEGKMVLSFIVLENGTTSQIRVVKSSGCGLLDDSAKEGVARTVISQKVPYRVVVRLPIIYKLRASKDGRT